MFRMHPSQDLRRREQRPDTRPWVRSAERPRQVLPSRESRVPCAWGLSPISELSPWRTLSVTYVFSRCHSVSEWNGPWRGYTGNAGTSGGQS